MLPSRTTLCSFNYQTRKGRTWVHYARAESSGGGGRSRRRKCSGCGVCCTADDADTVSRSSKGLERIMAVIVTVCSAFGRTVSEAKTEMMCLRTKVRGKVSLTSNAAATRYTNKRSSWSTWAGPSAQTENSVPR